MSEPRQSRYARPSALLKRVIYGPTFNDNHIRSPNLQRTHRRRFKCPKRGCLSGKKPVIFAAQRASQRFQYNLLKFMGLPINTYSRKQTVFSINYITQSMLIYPWIYPCGRCLVQFNAAPPFHGPAKGSELIGDPVYFKCVSCESCVYDGQTYV